MKIIKKINLILLLSLMQTFVAQIIDPVHANATVKDLGNKVYEMTLQIKIDKPWHLYSLDEQEFGIPTTVNFNNKAKNIQLLDSTKVIGSVKILKNDLGDQKVFENTVTFKRKFKILNPNLSQIIATIDYQVCNDKTCLAPTAQQFKLLVNNTEKAINQTLTKSADLKKDSLINQTSSSETNTLAKIQSNIPENQINMNKGLKMASIDLTHPISDCTSVRDNKDLWTIFGLGFLGGLLAILMPCIFPMIPLTVSFFTKNTNRKKGLTNAFLYGFFIVLIYLLLSVPFHLFDNLSANILNQISTNFWVNIAFFIIFVIFALSFFGYYELTLPSSWANKASGSSSKGGLLGSFFMALTLAIVSFSCTGPILGSLLVNAISVENGATQLTIAMAGFGLALALPFVLFAIFPSWLQSMPKSGGWMVSLKVLIGFLELALALKFLSKADLVGLNGPLGFLKKEVFLIIWIIIGIITILYLLKIIRFPHDDKSNKKISLRRWILIGLTVISIGYLATGLPKAANLQAMSGLVPPSNYSIFETEKRINKNIELETKHGINIFVNNLDYALQLAKQQNKPVLIDFTGYGCENCRRMEDNIWVDSEVNKYLRESVIVVSLYVDSTEELPEGKQETIEMPAANNSFITKTIKTQGDKWASFQAINFKKNSQPNYALLNADGVLLNADISGYQSKDEFLKFLTCGIATHQEGNN